VNGTLCFKVSSFHFSAVFRDCHKTATLTVQVIMCHIVYSYLIRLAACKNVWLSGLCPSLGVVGSMVVPRAGLDWSLEEQHNHVLTPLLGE